MIVATEVVAEAQVTWLVRSCVELSEKVPVAVNCSVSPLATLGFAGVTAIDWSAAARDRQHRRAAHAAERRADRGGARRDGGRQPRGVDRGDRGRRRRPGHLGGEVRVELSE